MCTDGKRILLVIAKSIWYLSFSCTQRGKWLQKQLRRVESPRLENRFVIAYLILTGVDERFWNEVNIVWKRQVVLIYAMKSEAGRGCIAPLVLNFGNGLSLVLTLTPLKTRIMNSQYAIKRKLGGAQIFYWRRGQEKVLLYLSVFELRTVQSVLCTILTALHNWNSSQRPYIVMA